jgi:hypothetical protein
MRIGRDRHRDVALAVAQKGIAQRTIGQDPINRPKDRRLTGIGLTDYYIDSWRELQDRVLM